jgi:hypothetical protein
MRIASIAAILLTLVFSVGCGMSGPGIARVQGAPPAGQVDPPHIDGVTPDKSWVSPYPQHNAALAPHLSEDISKRKLGEKPLSKDMTVDSEGHQLQGAEARQEERRQARITEWRQRMGLQSSKPHAVGEKPKPGKNTPK